MATYVVDSPISLDVLGSRHRLALLRYLTTHQGAFTGRELARAVGFEPKRASLALRRLVDEGFVHRQRAGRAFLYSINDDHYLVSEGLVPVFRTEQRWAESLGAEVRHIIGPSVASVILYGSWARGTADESSDIDLLIVLRRAADKRSVEARLAEHYERLTGRFTRPVSLLVLSRQELRNRVLRSNTLVSEITEQGRVLAGKSLAELLAHG